MLANEAYELNQEITLFVTTFGGEVQDLRRSISQLDLKPTKDCLSHYNEVVSHILEVLHHLARFIYIWRSLLRIDYSV
jgi:hypothetical protein